MKTLYILPAAIGIMMACSACSDDPTAPRIPDGDLCIDTVEEITDSIYANSAEIERIILSKSPTSASRSSMDYDITPLTSADGSPLAYVVNYRGDKGFVVVSARKALWPVLAYSDKGSFPVENLPAGPTAWIDDLGEVADLSDKFTDEHLNEVRGLWRLYEKGEYISSPESRSPGYEPLPAEDAAVIWPVINDSIYSWMNKGYTVYGIQELERDYPELYAEFDDAARASIWPEYEYGYTDVTFVVFKSETYETSGGCSLGSKWNQTDKFSCTFPPVGEGYLSLPHAYAGCVPVAMGQIMYSYKYPTTINWGNMPANVGNETISDFLYDIAIRCGATITVNGTLCTETSIAPAFRSYGYEAIYDDTFNESNVRSSIVNGHPVLASSYGYDHRGKYFEHACVIYGLTSYMARETVELWTCADKRRFREVYRDSKDSYSARYLHINWGWGGYGDGVYSNLTNALPHNAGYQSNTFVSTVTAYPKK